MIIGNEYFNPRDTFECGQSFRWRIIDDLYVGVVRRSVLVLEPFSDGFDVKVLGEPMSDADVASYFDEDADYKGIIEKLSQKDSWLEKATAFGKGIRLLNQDPFEMLITFIISSNNNIPKIKMSVEALSEQFGDCLMTYKGVKLYAFPTLEQLKARTAMDLNVKGMGYRARYIVNAVQQIDENNMDLKLPFEQDYETSKMWLKQLYGIGDKVADCVLLFSYKKKNAFPIDTWVKKMLRELYGIEDKQKAYETFVEEYFDLYGGYAQQYLFYYMRNHKS
jgi:N-glycosylase/DNA lyase